jgi:hypothetical protein
MTIKEKLTELSNCKEILFNSNKWEKAASFEKNPPKRKNWWKISYSINGRKEIGSWSFNGEEI